ncbi:MAG: hypothetical protein EHM52_05455 [Actinomycetota bacterium]|nr:MAG: hypothetical protein EHM52_05455 [Actinomycetota bacterium]
MDDFITIYYWARLAVLLLVTVIALITTIAMTARRPFKPWREITAAVLVVAAFVALSVIPGVYYGVVWAAVLVALGLVVGYLVNRGERVTREEGRVVLRRSPLVPWLWFVAMVLTLATLLFAETYLFSLSMLLMAFVMGAFIGQTIALVRAPLPAAAGTEPVGAPEASPA